MGILRIPENPSKHVPEESQKAASIIKAIKSDLVREQQHHDNVEWCCFYRSELSVGSRYRPGFTDSNGAAPGRCKPGSTASR